MSETADKYRRRGYWLKYLALRHIELLYYKPPFLSTTFSPYFHLFFQKVFHILPGLLISFSTNPACCLHLIHAHPQQVSFGTTIYTHFNQAFYKFSLVFFSAMCYIRKNVSTGYTVTILFFQITIQQILFREAFSLWKPQETTVKVPQEDSPFCASQSA